MNFPDRHSGTPGSGWYREELPAWNNYTYSQDISIDSWNFNKVLPVIGHGFRLKKSIRQYSTVCFLL
jgi:hypothetical protein